MSPDIDQGLLQHLPQEGQKVLDGGAATGLESVLARLPRASEGSAQGSGSHPAADFLDQAVQCLNQVITAPHPSHLTPEMQGHPVLSDLYANVMACRTFLMALVKGDLSQELRLKGYLAGVLKALQANLRHLTWQTQMIASGDFSQRVDFMGDFSEAFNTMVAQLHDSRRRLQEKQAELARLNDELRTEIELRKKTEQSLRESEELYRRLAMTDPLTGVYNRRHFFALAIVELQRSCRYRHPLSVVIFDLDHFKQVNDTHGHAVGDQVLQAFAGLVSATVRGVDIFARYGGEEFILMLPETGLDAGVAAAERIRLRVAEAPLPLATGTLGITVSGGVSCLDCSFQCRQPSLEVLDQLISQADQALYGAKEAGRNRISAHHHSKA